MNFYQSKLKDLSKVIYKNQNQIDAVIAIRSYIDSNFQDDLNLDLLSREQFISKYHMVRLFKRYYGLTPRQYLIDKRIERAKNLLLKGSTVTEACYGVGFESLGSFSSLFKKKTGNSPTSFQKEQLSRSI